MRKATGNHLITTWIVQGLLQDGKLENLEMEMRILKMDIIGISETHWKGCGEITTKNNNYFVYSGVNVDQQSRKGVGILMNDLLRSSINCIIKKSERIIMVNMKTKSGIMNVIQIYAPTADSEDDVCEEFYADLEEVLALTKKDDTTLIMGDFNAKVGKAKVLDIVGVYGLVNARFRNAIKGAKTYPGADIGSDHNPIAVKVKVSLKKMLKKKHNSKPNFNLLEAQETRNEIKNYLNQKVAEQAIELRSEEDIDKILEQA
ncbi:craniofacial development protein 2-like [Condylostylus longicornis]|uniref:craniofacial development protein 2-like n=1 Tax=Condylostylus longicornis TaxID=2530218 RepID=UPI00244DC873|nr:craniofacial development protein 2-like [Condylostylus longicornis]